MRLHRVFEVQSFPLSCTKSCITLYFSIYYVEALRETLSSAPLRMELPRETRCTSVCRVFVFHVPLTPPPVKTSPQPSCHTASALSHAWQREANLRCSRYRSYLGWEENFSQRQAGSRQVSRDKQDHKRRHVHTGRIRGFDMRGRHVPMREFFVIL